MSELFYKRSELRFQCQKCGACCTTWRGDIHLFEEDVARISKQLALDEATFRERYVAHDIRGKMIMKLLPNDFCPFYCDGCTIHEFKPFTCRAWPFWDYVTDTAAGWEEAKQQCPGVGKGRVYTVHEIERLRRCSPE